MWKIAQLSEETLNLIKQDKHNKMLLHKLIKYNQVNFCEILSFLLIAINDRSDKIDL